MLILAKLSETIIGENEEPRPERTNTFASRDLVRRMFDDRGGRGR